MNIGIGIDTGGTYTDAVACDLVSNSVIATAKALTTRHDLSVGIIKAYDRLGLPDSTAIRIVALSTTLTTNACVEDRLGRAALVFFGGDARLIDRYGSEYGLPAASEIILQPCSSSYASGSLDDVDWENFLDHALPRIRYADGVGVLETFAMRNGAVIESRGKELLRRHAAVPVVCGHELTADLDCLQRASTTLLNATLFPTISVFLRSMHSALEQRGVTAPVMIVKSDGSLMGHDFAASHPVDTLLSGPAASVSGCLALTSHPDCVVIDMGGTTTDIAVVNNGQPVLAENGVAVGRWKTFVKGLAIDTFGLGGDSAVHMRDGKVVVEPYRVVPLCVLGHQYPDRVRTSLRRLLGEVETHTRDVHQFLLAVQPVPNDDRFSQEEKALCQALASGPLIYRDAARAVGRDEYTLDVSRLIAAGVVQAAGLTPSDIMHIRGDFTGYDSESSHLAAEFLARNRGGSLENLCDDVYTEVKRKLYHGIVSSLFRNGRANRNAVPGVMDAGLKEILDQAFFSASAGDDGYLIRPSFSTKHALVGIGAPIHIFLPDVAAMLGTEAVLPVHAPVANALGAVMGKVHAKSVWQVRPDYKGEGIDGYHVFGGSVAYFKKREEAIDFGRVNAAIAAKQEAQVQGACGEVAVQTDVTHHNNTVEEGALYLGSTVTAHAIGGAGL